MAAKGAGEKDEQFQCFRGLILLAIALQYSSVKPQEFRVGTLNPALNYEFPCAVPTLRLSVPCFTVTTLPEVVGKFPSWDRHQVALKFATLRAIG
jgi:hypothetical protein